MKRYVAILCYLLVSVGSFAQVTTETLKMKMDAANQMTDNPMAFLAVMPDLVAYYEQNNIVDPNYVTCLVYLGAYYHATFNEQQALATYAKATTILQQKPYLQQQVPADVLALLHDAQTSLAYRNKAVKDQLSTLFLEGKYTQFFKQVEPYLQSRKAYMSNAYFSVSEKNRYKMATYFDKDLYFHYLLSAIYSSKDTSATGFLYDYILFYKQLQLRTAQQITQGIEKSGDQTLLGYYNQYKKIEKQLANSNPPASLPTDSLRNQLDHLGSLLALQSQLFADTQDVTWKDIQKALKEGEAAVEFVEFHFFKGELPQVLNAYAALIITKHCSTPIFRIVNTKSNLTELEVDKQSDWYDVNTYGNAMAQLFWRDLLFYFNDEKLSTIYFSPDGMLHTLAIETLPYSYTETTGQHFNMYRLSSTRNLVSKPTYKVPKTAVLYGDLAYRLSYQSMQKAGATRGSVYPLPATRQEVDTIASILKAEQYRVMCLSKEQGTEQSVKKMDGNSPTILHFATHGFVAQEEGVDIMKNTGLIMAYGARKWEDKSVPMGVDDGILTAAEIETLDLSGTDIVVLSACNTALGDVTPEGIWGLQRAFKKAGVNTVVMSLWQVDDKATALFMHYLYEGFVVPMNFYTSYPLKRKEYYVQNAFRNAQFLMSQHPTYSDPYYWASFIVID